MDTFGEDEAKAFIVWMSAQVRILCKKPFPVVTVGNHGCFTGWLAWPSLFQLITGGNIVVHKEDKMHLAV